MPAVTLKAHFDGTRIRLDDPYELPVDAPLMVTVLPATGSDTTQDLQELARRALARACGNDEPEYSDPRR